MLSIGLLFSTSTFATTYLVQLGTVGAATWDGSISGTVVNLATVNAGNPASLNAWFTDKILTTPLFSGTPALTGGDQIWIIKGTYYLTGPVGIKSGVKMYGGFAGTAGETVASRAKNSIDAWDFTNVTAFDGSVGGVKTYIGLSGGSTDTRTLIDGITIQNCNNASTSGSGGGAKVTSSGTTIQNCIITACTSAISTSGASAGITIQTGATLKDSYIHDNTNSSAGGGVAVTGVSCTVTGCKIDNNTAGEGGGIYIYSATSGSNITNCIISNNTANGSANGGGGIGGYVATTNASAVTVSGCIFTSNIASQSGGAIFFSNFGSGFQANAYNITNCTFTSNKSNAPAASAKGGGAIYLGTCTFSIDKCTFTGNQATLSGGGAILLKSSNGTTISNSKFTENTCASWGGSAIFSSANYTANNCLFANNTGSAPITFYASTAVSTFQNCTFASNLTSLGANAPIGLLNIGSSPYPQYTFANCLFYQVSAFTGQTGPTLTTCASDISLSTVSINTITSADFVDATNATIASRNYQLSPSSLALNKGTDLTQATSPVTKDIIDVTRPQGGAYDIGAYELPFFNTTVTFNANGIVNNYTTGAVDAKPQGTQLAFTITPNSGYKITSVLYNGTEVKGDIVEGVFTTPALVANATLVVQFDFATGLSTTQGDFQCFSTNQNLIVRGAKVGDELSIFTISGTKIKSTRVNSSNMSIALAQGMYFVKIANSVQKVAVK